MSALRRAGEGGQSIVEFALVMPVITIMFVSAFQLALIFLVQLSLTSATRDTVRWLAVSPDRTDASAQTTVRSRLAGNLDPARLTLSVSPACGSLTGGKCTGRNAGTHLTATLTYDASVLVLVPWVYLPSTTFSYTMGMRVEPH